MPIDLNMARYDGKSYGPPADLFDDTVAETLDTFADAEALNRAALVAPASWSEDALTFEATFATPHPVRRRDSRGDYLEVLDAATVDLSHVEGLPVYDGHRGGTARQTIGIVMSARREGETIAGTIRLSLADDVTPIRQRVAEGTIRHVSVGYRVTAWAETRDDAGNRIKTPTAWALQEVSLVPNPADPNARIRAQQKAPDATPRSGGTPLNNRGANGVQMEQEDQTLDRAEIQRRSEIRGLCRAAGLGNTETDNLIDTGATVAEAKATLWDHVQTRSASRPIIRTATEQNDDPATSRQRRADALAFRAGAREDLPEASRAYQHDSMMDHARACLEAAGVSTRGMSPDETLHRAAHTTSDFSMILQNTAGLSAMQAYEYASSPLMRLSRQRTVPDFKPATSVRLGEMGALEKVAESGEIKAVSRMETGESIRVDILERFCENKGDGEKPFDQMLPRHLRARRDAMMDTPAAANTMIKVLRQVFKFAVNYDLHDTNPAAQLDYLKTNADGYHSWTLAEIEQFEERHSVGTMARLAFAMALYTGQRRSDLVQFGRQHVRHEGGVDWLVFTQHKGRNRHPVSLEIPVIPELRRIIDATETGDLTFMVSTYGKPFTSAGFGNRFRAWA